MIYLILVLVFLSIVLISLGLSNLIFAHRIGVLNRLGLYTKEDGFKDEDISLREFLLQGINILGRFLVRKDSLEKKRKKLNQAYIFMRVEEFIGLSILSGFLLGGISLLLTEKWIIAIIGFILGYMIPNAFVNSIKKKRTEKLNQQLPEALNIISNGLRAGFSFNQAMDVASKELDSPIKDEFAKVLRDNSIGKTLDESLVDFSQRVDDEDVNMFITALLIQRRVGGNLAEILDTIAVTIRDRVRMRGEVKTLTAQGRISAIIISILPFGVAGFIFVSNPDYIMELFKNAIGIIMVVMAIIMQLIGIFIIMKMSNVEY